MTAVVNHSALPDIASATLPETYERAKTALARCDQIDECKAWADKAAALASYAKQAKDDTLHRLATRISARAIRRAGELLQTFQSPGGRPSKTTAGTGESFSQRKAAADAGMSPRQELTAVRVANVPADDFEAAVESDDPPTVTALAQRGTTPSGPSPFIHATHLLNELRLLAAFCDAHEARDVAGATLPHERAVIRARAATITTWLAACLRVLEEFDVEHDEISRHPVAPGNQREAR